MVFRYISAEFTLIGSRFGFVSCMLIVRGMLADVAYTNVGENNAPNPTR